MVVAAQSDIPIQLLLGLDNNKDDEYKDKGGHTSNQHPSLTHASVGEHHVDSKDNAGNSRGGRQGSEMPPLTQLFEAGPHPGRLAMQALLKVGGEWKHVMCMCGPIGVSI